MQQPCLWSENFNKLGRTVFTQPRINIFNFKRTDLVLDRIKQKPEKSAGMRIQDTHVFILVHSYRATSSLTLPQGGIH